MNTAGLLGLTLVLTLAACGGAGPAGGAPGGHPGGGSGGAQAEPWKVKGVVVDTRGRPLRDAVVWVKPALTTGVVITRTDAQGQYTASLLPNLDMPYRAFAWHQVVYRGQTFCLRLAATSYAQYETFTPSAGVIRNFKWQLSGAMPDAAGGNNYFGAEVRLMHTTWRSDQEIAALDSTVEVTLVPDGPLIDGSAGETLVKSAKVGENFLYDIPVGHYTVTAVEVRKDGSRTPLVVADDLGTPAAQGTLNFKGQAGTCGGAGTYNGVERAFLYVGRP